VQRKAAFIFLLLFLLSSSTVNQLFKLQALVTHYIEHQQRNCNIGVMDFLAMHYWGTDIDDNDDDKDCKLPFKAISTHSFQITFLSSSRIINIRRAPLPVIVADYPVLDESHLANPALNSLFRPPRA
jgi:hypothetical protein